MHKILLWVPILLVIAVLGWLIYYARFHHDPEGRVIVPEETYMVWGLLVGSLLGIPIGLYIFRTVVLGIGVGMLTGMMIGMRIQKK